MTTSAVPSTPPTRQQVPAQAAEIPEERPSTGAADAGAGPRDAELSAVLAGGLGPEEILAVCRRRMGDLDGQIRDVVRTMQQRSRTSRMISELAHIARTAGDVAPGAARVAGERILRQLDDQNPRLAAQLREGFDGCFTGRGSGDAVPVGEGSAEAPAAEGGGSWMSRTQDATERAVQVATPPGDIALEDENIEGFLDSCQEALTDLNSGTEMLQVQLQQLMNFRQQAMQLASNMLQSLHQTAMAVIGNTGRG